MHQEEPPRFRCSGVASSTADDRRLPGYYWGPQILSVLSVPGWWNPPAQGANLPVGGLDFGLLHEWPKRGEGQPRLKEESQSTQSLP